MNETERKSCCRLCIASEAYLLQLTELNLINLLKQIVCLDVSSTTSNYPEQICLECHAFLKQIESFIERCKQADEYFKNANKPKVEKNENKYEELNDFEFTGPFIKCEDELTLETKVKIKPERKKMKDRKKTNLDLKPKLERTDEFLCSDCPRSFTTNGKLALHERSHKPESIDKCPLCQTNVTNQTLADHIQTNHNLERTIRCESCTEQFYIVEQLNNHWLMNHRSHDNRCFHCGVISARLKRHLKNKHSTPSVIPCAKCGKKFKNDASLKDHLLRHARTKSACNICALTFWDVDSHVRKIHMTDQASKRMKCSFCGGLFADLKEIMAHQKEQHEVERASREPKIACDVCGKMVLSKMHLFHHKKSIHEKKRPYACKVCAKRFQHPGHLTSHMRCHTDERPWQCDLCEQRFRQISTMKSHRLIHTGEKPFKCEICSRDFRQRIAMKTHVKLVHLKKRK